MKFDYQAVGDDGRRVAGVIEARNRQEACEKLDRQRLQPLRLSETGLSGKEPEETRQTTSLSSEAKATDGAMALSRAEIIFFTEELGNLLDAGLQLESALQILEEREEKSALRALAAKVRSQVREGISFSTALRSTSASFGELYLSLIAAGELGGALTVILKRLASYLAALHELRNRVVQALIYPSFIVTAGIGLMILFVVVLVPQLSTLFAKTGGELPLVTRILIAVSSALIHYWWVPLGLIGSVALSFWQAIRRPAGRAWWHRTQLAIPLAGPVLQAAYYAQLSQTLANLVANGIPLLSGLILMERATPNLHLRASLMRVRESVAEGGSLSGAMGREKVFPPMFVDLVRIGEQTGNLAESLEKAGNRFEREMQQRILRITALIQPVMILVIAVVVGAVVYSIVTSIFQAISGMRMRH